jgi:ATP-dependent RNA helicase RhlE
MSESNQEPGEGFAQFNLDPLLMQGIEEAGFSEPRPIQAQTLPAALEGRDILGLAQTGTGKTAGFALPILERIVRERSAGPRALILAPTRELAAQILTEFNLLSRFARVKVINIYGGVGQRPQVQGLRNRPDVIVACPGRLLDLLEQGHAKLNRVETFVLDEADQMFDMGFMITIRKILEYLPEKRQNMLFSATMPEAVRHLADEMLSKPHVVELAHKIPLHLIKQVLYPVHRKLRQQLLEHLLEHDEVTRAIVFARTKHGARKLAERLNRGPLRVVGLQGNMSQFQREKVMRGFRCGKYDVLVATDIAARGIDVADVSHVINFDAPDTPEAYTHRIGRTGRAEQNGKACSFITHEDRWLVRAVERRTRMKIEEIELEEFMISDGEDVRELDSRPPKTGRSSRGRGSGGNSRRSSTRFDKRARSTSKSARGQSSGRKRLSAKDGEGAKASRSSGGPQAGKTSAAGAGQAKRSKRKSQGQGGEGAANHAQTARSGRKSKAGGKRHADRGANRA